MRKTIILAAFAALISFASCQKEEASDKGADNNVSPVFTASIAGATKTTVDMTDGKVTWVADDEITITDASSASAVYTIKSIDAETGKATFVIKEGQAALGAGPYTAVYGTEPATVQTWSETAGKLYMTAPETEDNSFTFTVQCGLMKLNLTKTGESVKSITVTGTPTGGSETTYTLTCDPAQSIASAKDFFIALPAGSYTKIEITNNDGEVCTLNSASGVAVASNHIKPITFGESKIKFGYQITAEVKPAGAGTVTGAGFYPKNSTATLTATAGGSGWTFIGWAKKDSPGTTISTDNPYSFTVSGPASYVAVFDLTDALPGLFTVNLSETQVRFSKGNLWCDGTGEGYSSENPVIKSWGFEPNQYDSTPMTNNTNRSTDHISHFLWCKSASESVKETYSETGTTSDDKFFTDNDDFAVNGVSSWRTLTGGEGGEWEYLLNKRETAYGTNRRYAEVKVNNIAGLLIFPDDFSSWPSGAGDEPQTFNTNSINWNGRDYTVSEFTVLQNNGCVFLPAAGIRIGDSDYSNLARVMAVGFGGDYWSASPNDLNSAYYLEFGIGRVEPSIYSNRNRLEAFSVRLVTECQ